MYKLLRNTHLFLGIAAFLFLLMYGFSAVQMAHDGWFWMKPALTESRVSIPAETGNDPLAVAGYLRNTTLRGELQDFQTTPSGAKFDITRPGAVFRVEYAEATRQARIRTYTATFMAILNRIHHIRGLWHDFWPVNAWGLFVALVSAGLIVIGATGIYLWFKLRAERAIGVVLLAVNLAACVTLLVLIRTA